jgi:hypothetical protein
MNSNNLVLELQYYFNKILLVSNLNLTSIPKPIKFPDSYMLDSNSFIRLLLDDTWPSDSTSFVYLYREETNKSLWPSFILNRLMLYPNSSKYYTPNEYDENCINFFNLQFDDFLLLDKLLLYRTNPFYQDSTSGLIIDVDYQTLSTNLSKMIYLYLDLKINNNVSLYDDTTLLSTPNNLLENIYETYLVENMFTYIQTKEIILSELHNEVIK